MYKSPPKWMSDAALAQYQSLWGNADFKKLSEKNKKNRNSYCGGMGPSLHTGGSILMTEHGRRLKEKLGEEPSHATCFKLHTNVKTPVTLCAKKLNMLWVINSSEISILYRLAISDHLSGRKFTTAKFRTRRKIFRPAIIVVGISDHQMEWSEILTSIFPTPKSGSL
nr:putative transposase En/Spm [Ipomoea batatas]